MSEYNKVSGFYLFYRYILYLGNYWLDFNETWSQSHLFIRIQVCIYILTICKILFLSIKDLLETKVTKPLSFYQWKSILLSISCIFCSFFFFFIFLTNKKVLFERNVCVWKNHIPIKLFQLNEHANLTLVSPSPLIV